jgi:hypothetical protein
MIGKIRDFHEVGKASFGVFILDMLAGLNGKVRCPEHVVPPSIMPVIKLRVDPARPPRTFSHLSTSVIRRRKTCDLALFLFNGFILILRLVTQRLQRKFIIEKLCINLINVRMGIGR